MKTVSKDQESEIHELQERKLEINYEKDAPDAINNVNEDLATRKIE